MFTDLALVRGGDGVMPAQLVSFVYENSTSRHMINIHQRRVEISRDISITIYVGKRCTDYMLNYFHYFITFHCDKLLYLYNTSHPHPHPPKKNHPQKPGPQNKEPTIKQKQNNSKNKNSKNWDE